MTNYDMKMMALNERKTRSLESIGVSLNTIANAAEEIRIELKKKRFDDAEREKNK